MPHLPSIDSFSFPQCSVPLTAASGTSEDLEATSHTRLATQLPLRYTQSPLGEWRNNPPRRSAKATRRAPDLCSRTLTSLVRLGPVSTGSEKHRLVPTFRPSQPCHPNRQGQHRAARLPLRKMAKRAYHHTMYREWSSVSSTTVHQLTAVDEAEGFILEHALISPPRTWPPLPPEPDQQARVSGLKRKMDWEGEAAKHPDEPVVMDAMVMAKGNGHASGHGDKHEDAEKERCVICLMALRDRTIVGVCGHEFCVSVAWDCQSG